LGIEWEAFNYVNLGRVWEMIFHFDFLSIIMNQLHFGWISMMLLVEYASENGIILNYWFMG